MWDITKLKGPQTWTSFISIYHDPRLYRGHVVGWLVAERESAILATT